ncbi:arginase [Hyalangium versicolor]|uniref:arginase n=1 Tax=Hyalangium versicolor TaxID=2861190 RepID=UPI001CC98104|nr:arginase [Hyalangium versicolor]
MHIEIVGVPADLGAGEQGAALGPQSLREAGLFSALLMAGHTVEDLGDVQVPTRDSCLTGDPRLRYLEPIRAVAMRVRDATAAVVARGHFPLVIGGDHSLSLGSIRGAAQRKRLGVIWIDAHGDFNTHESTLSGNIHGMPLASLVGLGETSLINLGSSNPSLIDPSHVVLFGVRALDPGETELLAHSEVTVLSMDAIRQRGVSWAITQAIQVASRDTDGIYVSIDLDGMDPEFAPGVTTPVSGGLTREDSLLACSLLGSYGRLVGMDLVELNPTTDVHRRTATLAVELARTLLGSSLASAREDGPLSATSTSP